jgi:putative peptide zinc metalloprotease protein
VRQVLGRRRAAALLATLACAAPAGLGVAQADDKQRSKDNVAVATTETDGARAFDFSYSLHRQRGGVVDHRNIANAAARCTDCRATSIAFQIVLVRGTPEQLTPRNQAVAINDQCTRCVVYAGARQFVRVVDGDVRFTEEGVRTLLDVRNQLRALEHADLDVAGLAAKVEEQEQRVLQVLRDELVAKDDGSRAHVRDRDDNEADD